MGYPLVPISERSMCSSLEVPQSEAIGVDSAVASKRSEFPVDRSVSFQDDADLQRTPTQQHSTGSLLKSPGRELPRLRGEEEEETHTHIPLSSTCSSISELKHLEGRWAHRDHPDPNSVEVIERGILYWFD